MFAQSFPMSTDGDFRPCQSWRAFILLNAISSFRKTWLRVWDAQHFFAPPFIFTSPLCINASPSFCSHCLFLFFTAPLSFCLSLSSGPISGWGLVEDTDGAGGPLNSTKPLTPCSALSWIMDWGKYIYLLIATAPLATRTLFGWDWKGEVHAFQLCLVFLMFLMS